MCFPNENYNYAEMKDNSIWAYDNGNCIGLAILQDAWFKYMYLYDLKVSKDYRHKGVATALMKKEKRSAKNIIIPEFIRRVKITIFLPAFFT